MAELSAGDETPITVGELRELFGFNLDRVVNLHGDTFAEAVAAGRNPNDWFDGQEHRMVTVEGLPPSGPPGYFLPTPWTVRLFGPNGSIWVNSPVTFSVKGDSPALLSPDAKADGPLTRELTVWTDDLGYAWIYIYIAPSP